MANYDFDADAREKILAAIKQKRPVIRCYVCETEKWTLGEGFIALPLLENFYMNRRSSGSLVGIALVCDKCGNTLLMNLGQLGLSHLVAPDINEARKQWGLPPR
jgi:hypothetical protein